MSGRLSRMMFEEKPSSHSTASPPAAHSSSSIPSPFRTPLDLSSAPDNGGYSSANALAAALDLHAALTSLSKASSSSSSYPQPPPLNFSLSGLAGITAPPAVPPHSSKFWDTPPPSFSHLSPSPSSLPLPLLAKNVSSPSSSSSSAAAAAAASISSLSAASAFASQFEASNNGAGGQTSSSPSQMSKYSQLLAVLEEMGKDVRPSYAGSKSSAERLKRGIIHARILVREALMEVDRASKQ